MTDDPSALGGGDIDKHVIYEGLSRVAADAVLAGARTIGAAGLVLSVWRPELTGISDFRMQISDWLRRALNLKASSCLNLKSEL